MARPAAVRTHRTCATPRRCATVLSAGESAGSRSKSGIDGGMRRGHISAAKKQGLPLEPFWVRDSPRTPSTNTSLSLPNLRLRELQWKSKGRK
jgi:hypothetical protein